MRNVRSGDIVKIDFGCVKKKVVDLKFRGATMKKICKDAKDFLKLLNGLVQNDLKARYSGSMLGMVWAYVQPMVTILVFWYVFQVGFRNSPVDDVEYILWFIAGYIPWTYFNDAISSSSNVMYEYSYLVKKMKFKTWMLPIIKVLSSFYIHFYFIIFILGMYLLYGYDFKFAWLSTFYYSAIFTILIIGLAYLCATLSVFFKDFSHVVNIVLQIGFWLAPIFWSETSMSENVLRILKRNPVYYIITGYRESLMYGVGFWEHTDMALWYWGCSFGFLLLGVFVYKKLKVHFADLL